MTEIMFECYNVPSVTYGIDSLFSYKYNKGNTGIVVSSSYTSTHVIPVYRSKAILSQAVRLNWGGWHGAEYLLKLIKLKYPNFPGKLNASQAEYMIRDHCYVSTDYSQELSRYLDWTGLEDRERVIQYPYTEEVVVQKTEEELARIAERKKESGRRLQEQAAKMRLEKLMRKEEELAYYKDLQRRISEQTNKKEVKRLLDADELRDEAALDRTIRELERSIKRARQKDVGGEAEEEAGEPVFDLLDVPDDQLDEAGLKAKRQQKLLKSNYEARQRAKAEKEAERQRIEEERRLDEERREKDREGWIAGRRQQLAATLARLKERQRIRQDMSNRKSLASQMRMKSIANLASDAPGKKRRRAGGGGDQDDDDFGANDDDWGVYRQIQVGGDDEGRGEGGGSDDEEGGGGEEEIMNTIRSIEADLLRYDPDFRREDTWDAQHSWDKSLLHAFMRGPRPFDEGSAAQLHQVVLNVERIRVPEVVFQPSIAGVDQAGLAEIVGTLLRQRLAYPIEQQAENGTPTGSTVLLRDQLLRDVFLTGGNTLFKGFDERLRAELAPQLPPSAPLAIRRASDPVLDAWRGAAEWVGTDSWRAAQVTREEYLEKGGEYIKVRILMRSSLLFRYTVTPLFRCYGSCVTDEQSRRHAAPVCCTTALPHDFMGVASRAS